MLPTNPLLNATAPAGPHLPATLLRQYAAGTLAPAAQHRVEAHTLACPRCADILAGLQQTLPATTDQALAQLQQRLRQRVQQQAAPARHDREEQRNRWLIPQLAAAAALLLGLVAGGWWAWQQRHRSSPEIAAVSVVPTVAAPTAAPTVPGPAPAAPAGLEASAETTRSLASHQPLAAPNARKRTHVRRPPSTTRSVDSIAASKVPLAATSLPPAAPTANEPIALVPVDSAGILAGRANTLANKAKQLASYDAAPPRAAVMPAAPKLAPAPVGGYSALREKLRREATEFKPESPERPLSGTVQLRLTIGADGNIQQTKVLRGLREDYDAEAQRLVCDGPGWIPGISGGKRAPLEVDIAVPF